MKKNMYVAIIILSTILAGCGASSQAEMDASTIESLNSEITELKEENENLREEVKALSEEKAAIEAELTTIKNDDTNDTETEAEVEVDEEDATVTIADFEIIDNADSLIVNYKCNGEAHQQRVDYAAEVGSDYYAMKYDFSSQVADVDNDGKDEVLINMYYANNVIDGVCTSVLYALDENEEIYPILNLNDFNLPSEWYVYSDTFISDEGISVTGLWKNDETYEIESETIEIQYAYGGWTW